jgi:hypothetical protein
MDKHFAEIRPGENLLTEEEVEYIRTNQERCTSFGRIIGCGHLMIFHYGRTLTECGIEGCDCSN